MVESWIDNQEIKENKIPKTKKCDWCKSTKKVEEGYSIKDLETKKVWFICGKCNLEHDVV